ncbi:hypothetical protein HBI56_074630 [Parastagonospora nodorum]|uniref:Zn(2)-C6 fungal-type domain-containing protein n=1 Tax=Phaeosphaeria nodorum (strain SN15 / ATCC MYA-4574 / FGSC 10173) TaxID=321614 RepID=A0A7U2EYX1_PHANO|nr:hypothetical protein HBH52_059960 [Parastagonospora nodorum]QRC94443.1 hypothetical protein JI435_076820 [Parastagonospora nodorum SN15]KAH3985394.1 hypothetical protein HBH51_018800 [Parastagonospora nodorum]KAH4003513.1 hypothetical protein HBI10_057950 [Parastagonospora nodorum]KAH4065065.1 hypothetical protein HBH50_170830 [Parastagonospora nodorum]
MFPHHQGAPGQLPTHWQPPTSQQPANGAYPPPGHMQSALPPPPPQEPRADMAARQHPQYQQPQYRLPGPNEWNRGPPPPDPYAQQAPPPQYVQQHHQPPAPRQRTAIACRYCRRRKIRCSGFEATEDGRCSNCMRFNQDCIFTPVSAQTQAFVPAHTVWRGVGQPPPMYGAYGQPLPPASHAEAYGQQPPQQPRQQGYLPSPTAATPTPPYSSAPPPASQPYYTAAPPRQSSPQGAYRYEPSRASSSPHSQAPTTPGAPSGYAPLQPPPPRSDGRTPPPTSQASATRPSMRINDLVSDNGAGRSSTDSSMLNMLNRRPM